MLRSDSVTMTLPLGTRPGGGITFFGKRASVTSLFTRFGCCVSTEPENALRYTSPRLTLRLPAPWQGHQSRSDTNNKYLGLSLLF